MRHKQKAVNALQSKHDYLLSSQDLGGLIISQYSKYDATDSSRLA